MCEAVSDALPRSFPMSLAERTAVAFLLAKKAAVDAEIRAIWGERAASLGLDESAQATIDYNAKAWVLKE